jgi:hypothetical protein
MAPADHRSRLLSDMADCAYRLGMAFGAAAETAQGTDRWLKYFNAFDRCFFAVRVATALELRLRRAPAELREAASDREDLIERPDPETDGHDRDSDERDSADRDSDERDSDERDRDRETERASLPILLRTLEGVVADAAALPGPEPAALPTLRELLAHAKAGPGPGSAAPRPAHSLGAHSLRSRLTGSGAATAPPPTPHLASNVGQVLAARRATGPPRR